MKFFMRFMPAALVSLSIIFMVSSAKANEKEAEQFIRTLANQAIQVLADTTLPLDARESRLRTLLNNSFAMSVIGRYVVGSSWRKMTQAQKNEYQKLFSEWTLSTYSARLGGYKNQQFKIIKAVDSGKKDIFVRTSINQPSSGKPIKADWRVRKIKGQYKIVDIGVEGISMLLTQKREFGALLRRQGIVGLIEMLRMRNSKFPAVSG